MLFNSLVFPIFAAIFFPIYFLLRGRARTTWVVACSYFFYGWWDYRFVSLLLISTLVDFQIGLALDRPGKSERSRRMLLYLSLAVNLGVLGFFKYFNFFLDSFYQVFGTWFPMGSRPVIDIVLPVGISFYTFQTLSYSIDLYRRQIPHAEKDWIRFAAYVALFPQLVAGPIVRAADLLPQLREDHPFNWRRIGSGFELCVWGMFLKLGLADTAATVVNPRFFYPEGYGSLSQIVGVWCFAMQIYGDFAGYSLVAIGLGRMMGLDFGVNFNRPYFAASFSDFWGRWHISLSSWLRDYLYISLGGNRGGKARTMRNLMLTMLLGGLWHGAGLTFIVWGALHGSYLVLQRIVEKPFGRLCTVLKLPRSISRLTATLTVFVLTCVAWVFFRSDTIDKALSILNIISQFDDMRLRAGQQLIGIVKTIIFAALVFAVDFFSQRASIHSWYQGSVPLRCLGVVSLVLILALLGTYEGASFLYFQF